MPNQRNLKIVADLTEKLKNSQSVVFTTYTGLTVPQMQELRAAVKEVEGDVAVVKNTLVSLAFGQAGMVQEGLDLKGQTALVLGYADPISPIKKLFVFNEKYGLPLITGGYFEGSLLDAAAVEELSRLPGQLELREMLVRTLVGPIRGLMGVCNGAVRDLAYVLGQIAEVK